MSLTAHRIPLLLPWLWEARKLWLFAAVVAGSFIGADWAGSCAAVPQVTRLTWAGWALQMFGVFSIAMGIWRKERQFGKPGLVAAALEWLARIPLRARHHRLHAGSGKLTITGGRARLEAWTNPPADADLAARIASLERNIGFLRDAMRSDHAKHEQMIEKLRAELKAERDARESHEIASTQRLEVALVGDVHLEHMSVIWVMLGLTAATVPELLQSVFGWMYELFALPFGCR